MPELVSNRIVRSTWGRGDQEKSYLRGQKKSQALRNSSTTVQTEVVLIQINCQRAEEIWKSHNTLQPQISNSES